MAMSNQFTSEQLVRIRQLGDRYQTFIVRNKMATYSHAVFQPHITLGMLTDMEFILLCLENSEQSVTSLRAKMLSLNRIHKMLQRMGV